MSFRTFRRFAGLVALAAFTLAVYLCWRGSSRPIFLNQSIATMAAVLGSAIVAVSGSIAFFLPDDFELRFMYLMLKWRKMAPPTGSNIWLCVALAAVVVHGCFSYSASVDAKKAYIDDEADYLRVADEIDNLPGGARGLLPSLFRGEFKEDNRNPLYPVLMAVFGADWDFPIDDVDEPIVLSTWFGMAVVATTSVIAWRLFGPAVAALSALLVAINGAMIQASSLIACETLLVLLTTFGWYAFATSNTPMKWPRALLIGGIFGLAYLTKASALFPLLIIIGMTGLNQISKPRWLAPTMMAIGFVVVASPLLTRNIVRYHNPLHSFNNKLLFAESYESGIVDPDLGSIGNLKRYLGRHSVKEVVVDRFFGGLMWEGFVLLRTLGPAPMDSWRVVFGGAFLLTALLGMGTQLGGKLAPSFLIMWAAWFLLFFGWYQPIASGDRFLLPLVPPLTIAASLGLLCLARAGFSCYKNP